MVRITEISDPCDIGERRLSSTALLLEMGRVLSEVRKKGDKAVRKYEKKFAKNPKHLPKTLRVPKSEIKNARKKVPKEQLDAIKLAKKYLENTEKKTISAVRKKIPVRNGRVRIMRTLEPLESVGCYVPGGGARYPSSVVMSTVPAKTAGVKRIIVCSPPDKTGSIDPLTLAAADICGATEVYAMGGPQAIGAMAYGTESVEAVDKIVGPGGRYVTAAKLLVSSHTGIDMVAGPTELAIIADRYANPRLIAADLESQAEHGTGSWCILVTDSRDLADKVSEMLEKTMKQGSAKPEIYVCASRADLSKAANAAAPEHLQIMMRNPESVAKKITKAGLVLVGNGSPSAASDYLFGTNHILPTNLTGRSRGSLSALDFLKLQTRASCTSEGLRSILNPMDALTEAEGLRDHYAAVEARFR